MKTIPFKLSEGLFLEGKGKILPWFKSLHQITKMGGKPLPKKGKTQQLFWESETIFNDLPVSIQAMAKGNGMFFLDLKSETEKESIKIEYERIEEKLISRFGAPSERGEEGGYPFSRWFWGDICLSLAIAEHFMEYISLSVSNEVIKRAL